MFQKLPNNDPYHRKGKQVEMDVFILLMSKIFLIFNILVSFITFNALRFAHFQSFMTVFWELLSIIPTLIHQDIINYPLKSETL